MQVSDTGLQSGVFGVFAQSRESLHWWQRWVTVVSQTAPGQVALLWHCTQTPGETQV
jgi:hypothetical protein